MQWLFVLGVALEVAGALLIAASLLLPIVLRRWDALALRGHLFPRGGPKHEDMLEPAYAAVGAVLLIGGFVTQLAGYIVEFNRLVLAAVAAATATGALVGGALLARYGLAGYFLRKARTNDPTGGRPGRHGAL